MTPIERKATYALAAIFAFRMLGLFMILPVFAIYAYQYRGTTPTLIGLALGIYGLTQAILQIPFGLLSDRFNRKTIITIGLLLFAGGSIIAATAHSIHMVIIGRAIQGSGAVGSVILALVADLTYEQNRTKAMAIIGLTIGFSFTLAMILGPLFTAWQGLSSIFWFIVLLSFMGIAMLHFTVPSPSHVRTHRETQTIPSQLSLVIKNRELLRLDFGIFCLHALLTATFIVFPILFTRYANIHPDHQWIVYLPILLASFIVMLPFIIIAEKKRQIKRVFLGSIIVLIASQLLSVFLYTFAVALISSIFIFMTAFTLLEATLPSLISKIAPAGSKGTAMGVYSSAQFLGIFIGGTLGGWLYDHYAFNGVFSGCLFIAIIWFIIASRMKQPPHLATYVLALHETMTADNIPALTHELKKMRGVADVLVIIEEGVAYLKVDNAVVNKELLATVVTSSSQ